MCSDCVVCDNAHDVSYKRCGCKYCDDGDCNTDCCADSCSCRATFNTKEKNVPVKPPKPPTKILKLDPAVHKQITDAAEAIGILPGDFVTEAVTYYLDQHRQELIDRASARLTNLLSLLDAARLDQGE